MRTYATKNKKKKMKKKTVLQLIVKSMEKLRRAYGLRNLNK